MYKLNSNSVTRLSDNACIPFAEGNTDYAQFLTWLAEGNTPEPADVPNPNAAINAQIEVLLNGAKLNRGSLQMEVYLIEKEAREYSETYGLPMELILSGNSYYPQVKALDLEITALRGQLT